MNLSRKKILAPIPPEKGSFPLDHKDECGEAAEVYNSCVKHMEGVHRHCTEQAQEYLKCRMAKYVFLLLLLNPLVALWRKNPCRTWDIKQTIKLVNLVFNKRRLNATIDLHLNTHFSSSPLHLVQVCGPCGHNFKTNGSLETKQKGTPTLTLNEIKPSIQV